VIAVPESNEPNFLEIFIMKLLATALAVLALALAGTSYGDVTFAMSSNNQIVDANGDPLNAGTAVLYVDLDDDSGPGGVADLTDPTNSDPDTYLWDAEDAFEIITDWSAWATLVPPPFNVNLHTFQWPGTTLDGQPGYDQNDDNWYVLLFDNGGSAAPGANTPYTVIPGGTVPPPGGTGTGSFDPEPLDLVTVPEPTTLALLGLGGLVALRRRRA
jgi:hypothetical protein